MAVFRINQLLVEFLHHVFREFAQLVSEEQIDQAMDDTLRNSRYGNPSYPGEKIFFEKIHNSLFLKKGPLDNLYRLVFLGSRLSVGDANVGDQFGQSSKESVTNKKVPVSDGSSVGDTEVFPPVVIDDFEVALLADSFCGFQPQRSCISEGGAVRSEILQEIVRAGLALVLAVLARVETDSLFTSFEPT